MFLLTTRPHNSPEQELLERIANKDTKALETLYDRCAAKLLGIQLRILKNQELAEDALQDAFIKIWENASKFDVEKGSASVWLNSLARNTALDSLRKVRLRAPLNTALFDINLVPDTQTSTQKNMDDSDQLSICLERLPTDSQQCLVSVYCEGYTSAEMSESLGRSESTIKSWLRRGLRALKECLDELN